MLFLLQTINYRKTMDLKNLTDEERRAFMKEMGRRGGKKTASIPGQLSISGRKGGHKKWENARKALVDKV